MDALREQHCFTNARKAQAQSWYAFSSGYRGIKYGAYFSKAGLLVAEIYLDAGDKDWNKRRFDGLGKYKEALNTAFGSTLDWQRLDHRQASRICVGRVGGIADDGDWSELLQWLVVQLLGLQKLWDGPMKTIIEKTEESGLKNE